MRNILADVAHRPEPFEWWKVHELAFTQSHNVEYKVSLCILSDAQQKADNRYVNPSSHAINNQTFS
jgi:hypothetical protein